MFGISLGTFFTAMGTLIVVIAVLLHFYFKKAETYWPKRGFSQLTSRELGGAISNLIRKVSLTQLDINLYTRSKNMEPRQPATGFLEFTTPALVITDMELIRNVFVKDFDHFSYRRQFGASKLDPFVGSMLFFMNGEPWKELRTKMTPTFTTGKIRRMFEIVNHCGDRLVKYLNDEEIGKNSPDGTNFTTAYGKYTLDVISTTAFGIESGAFGIGTEKSMFEKMAEKLRMRFTLTMIIRILILVIAPKIAMMIGMSLFDPTACAFFKSIIQRTIKHRDENPKEKRDDFLQLMLEAKAGQLKSDAGADAVLDTFEKEALLVENEAGKDEHANVHEHAHAQKEKPKVILNDDAICAQSVLFLFGGFDTMQTLLQFGAYHLALDSDIQDQLAEEVDNCWKANGGKFTYDTINTLEYMDKFIMETLRMYPPLMRFDRECTKDYKIPGTDLVIPTGMGVIIPTYAIHHDPEIYPEPEKFDPERFSKEGKATRSPYAFMPFGHGPKNCIGMRFALTEAKLAFAHLIHNFKLEPSAKTLIPMKLAFSFNMKPDGDMWLKLSPRK